MPRATGTHANVVDETLVSRSRYAPVRVSCARIGPSANIVQSNGGVRLTVAILVDPHAGLDRTNLHHAVAIAIRTPNCTVQINGGTRGVLGLAVGRSPILTLDFAGAGVDFNDRAFRRHRDPQIPAGTGLFVELQLIRSVAVQLSSNAFGKIGRRRVGAGHQIRRVDRDTHIIRDGTATVRCRKSERVTSGSRNQRPGHGDRSVLEFDGAWSIDLRPLENKRATLTFRCQSV